MKRYRIKDNDFVNPFEAKSDKEAAKKALEKLGFGFGAKEDIKEKGAEQTLKDLGEELEII